MIFGFGKNKKQIEEETEEEEIEYVVFQGALSGREVNLSANARLAQAALVPTKELITDALLRRAEGVRIDPKGDRAIVTLMIDGVPYSGGRMPKQQGHAVTQMTKLLSGLDINERKKPQSGGVRAELENKKYELRVKSAPAEGGVERLSISVRDLSVKMETPEELGFPPEMKAKIREMTSHKKGILLGVGPSGSGTSSTTYGMLRAVDAYQYTVYTFGDLQGRDLPNVVKFEKLEGDDLQTTFDRAVRAEGDVIFLDPLRDKATADVMFKNQERLALISEFQGKDCQDVIRALLSLVQLVGDAKVVAEGLNAIVSQKLIRKICTKCRAAYRPHPKLLAKVGLPPETRTLFRTPPATYTNERGEEVEIEPCGVCGGVGYLGRVAMFEMLEMTDAMRQLIIKGGGPPEIKTLMRKEKMPTLQQAGLKLVAEGVTSLEELQRAFQPKKPPKK